MWRRWGGRDAGGAIASVGEAVTRIKIPRFEGHHDVTPMHIITPQEWIADM
jgi:hypothetical protein